ncbi:hypothetical protein DXM49_24750 [Salmonella enterica]|nr:hypothetical protein [Salmonella enterica]EEB7791987.1 hypothetical protein [Salmonella enterica]
MGKGNARNKLHVIINPTGWVPDPKGGDGVIKLTKDVRAYFSVMADGDQIVPADEYSIVVKGECIEPS